MGINGVGSFCAQNYDVPNRGRATRGKTSVDDFASMGSATSLSEVFPLVARPLFGTS